MAEPLDIGTIRAYLLGRLTGPERETIATRILEDEEVFASARELEDDLIDALARGELDEPEAGEVRQFLVESSQADRLRFAAALARAGRPTIRGPVFVRSFLAIAAVFILAMVGAFYYFKGDRAAMKAKLEAAEKAPVVFAFSVPPGTVRGGGGVTRVRIPSGTNLVRVKIDLEKGYQSYSAVLRAPGGREVVRSTTGELVMPAPLLPHGRYEIEVTGSKGGGAPPETLNFYYFEIE